MNGSSSMTEPVTNAATRSDEMTMDKMTKSHLPSLGGLGAVFGEDIRMSSHFCPIFKMPPLLGNLSPG